MAEDAVPPTAAEFAARYKPQRPTLESVFAAHPVLWDDVVRLRDEFRLTWNQIADYLALHGVQIGPVAVRQIWQRRQTR